MIIVKKLVLFMMVFTLTFLIFPVFALGSEAQWEIIYNDNNDKLEETITIYGDGNITVDTSEWDVSSSAEKTTMQREVANWQVYNTLSDRLPVEAEVKDYILFKSISLKGLGNAIQPQSLFSQIVSQDGINLRITLPGIKNESNAEQVEDFTYVWHLSKTSDLDKKPMLKVNTWKGFFLGLFIFILGFLIIVIVFLVRMRKVHRLIEEEYSIERAKEELLKANEVVNEPEKSDEIEENINNTGEN